KGKQKGRAAEQFQPGATVSPAGPLTTPATSPALPERGKRRGRSGEQVPPGAASTPLISPSGAPEYGKPEKGRHGEQFGQPRGTPEGVTAPEGKRKGFERGYQPTPGGATSPIENLNEQRGKHKQFEQQQPGASPTAPQGNPPGVQGPYGEERGKHRQFEQQQSGTSPAGAQGAGPYGEERGKRRAEGVNAPPQGGANQGEQTGERKLEGRGKGAPSATPSPQ